MLTIFLAVPFVPAAAHEPSPGFKRWTDSQLNQTPWTYSKYDFTAAVPGWLQTAANTTLKSNWASSQTNNSHGIRFDDDPSGAGTVRYNTSASACPGTGWLGCADTNTGFDWDMWFNSSPTYGGNPVKWCQDPSNSSSTCWSAYRIGIHETLHVGGFLDDLNGMGETNTRMDSPPIGSASSSVARCDLARLQMWYDVAFIYEDYPDCWHEVANTNADGSLVVDLTASPSSTMACSGSSVVVKGRLWIHNYDSYKKIGGNNLASRVVDLYRGSSTNIGFTFTNQTPNDAEPNDNWSKTISQTVSGTTTYTYHAEFNPLGDDNGPFSDKSSANFSITWINPALC